ncbi:MAG TPA: ribose 5-phosphate isomerase B [Acidobacteriota bacterium]|nr:ribose 5-phosphate isomerase B [Acidobacteriota bacterium]
MDAKELESLVRSLVEKQLAELRSKTASPAQSPPKSTIKVVTEMDVRDAGVGGTVLAAENAIITAAAEDLARAWGVLIQKGPLAGRPIRRIALGADHGGFELKEQVRDFLLTLKATEVLDLGTHSKNTVDYPDIAEAVAEAVACGKADFGIIVDGAGIGSAIAANKVPGIRAAMCYDAVTARNSREHNFANVLTLGGRMIDGARMREIVGAFLETPTGEERHAARVRKIMEIERKYRGFRS